MNQNANVGVAVFHNRLFTGLRAIVAALSIASLGIAPQALAQTFPSKPLRIVVPFAAGGTSDILARTLGQKLTESMGQQVIVDNRPGANGNIGADFVAKAPPDGYTMLLTDLITLVVSPSIYPKLPFDPSRDLVGVSMVAYSPHLFVVSNQTPVKNVAEFIALAKSKPSALNYATAGAGSAPQLAGALFAQRAGISWTYIHYKGGAQAIADLASGAADVTFNGMLATYPLVRGGKLKPLAISSETRWPSAPDIPTVAEMGFPGFVTGSFQGLLAPGATPRPLIDRLNAEIAKILMLPDVRERMASQGADARAMPVDPFAVFLRDEADKWSKVVREASIKAE